MIELRRALPFLAFFLVVFAAGCSMLPGSPAQPQPASVESPAPIVVAPLPPGRIGPADLESQRQVWQKSGVTSYTWEVLFGCECLLNGVTKVRVQDGVAVEAVNNGAAVKIKDIEGFPLTLDAVFAEAKTTLEGGGVVTAEWAASGLPKQLNLDRDVQMVDDELGISILSVKPAE